MSDALVLKQPDPADFEPVVSPVVHAADSLRVTNVAEHQVGMELLVDVMTAEVAIKRAFKDSKDKAHAAHKAICALEKQALEPVEEARRLIEEKCGAFEAEERRIAKENQAAMAREALSRQEEERQMDAAMAATPEEAEDALTKPLPPPLVPTVRPDVAKVAGVTSRETWSAEVTDKAVFLKWCLDTGNLYMVDPSMTALNGRARAEKAEMRIPGVKAVASLGYSRR